MTLALPRQAAYWIQAASMALLWRLSVRDTCDGIEVGIINRGKEATVRPRVNQALALLRELDPRRYRVARRQLRGILITDIGSNRYSRGGRTCILAEQQVATMSDAVTASSIVHETTHARFAGIRTLLAGKRIEARCIREQIDFAAHLPGDRYPNTQAYIRWLEGWIGVWPVRVRFGERYRRLLQEKERHAIDPAA